MNVQPETPVTTSTRTRPTSGEVAWVGRDVTWQTDVLVAARSYRSACRRHALALAAFPSLHASGIDEVLKVAHEELQDAADRLADATERLLSAAEAGL